MKINYYFRDALRNLISTKLRSFLAVLGVLVGTASVVALISSSELATAHAMSEFKKLGTNLLSIYVRKETDLNAQANVSHFDLSDAISLQKSSQAVTSVAPYTLNYLPIYFQDTLLNGQIIGATGAFERIAKIQLSEGRFISSLDKENLYCVIGSDLADAIKASGQEPLLNQLRVGQTELTIVGVMKKWPTSFFISANLNDSIIMPLSASYLLSKNVDVNNILVKLQPNAVLNAVKSTLTNKLESLLPNEKANFNSPEELIHLVSKSRQTMNYLLIGIGSISLIVGGIGVMNIMLVSVIERRREIGIRLAIGARQRDIVRLFLIEAIILTLFGGFLGITVGVLSSYVFTVITGWHFYFYGFPIVLGFLVSVVVGILSGFYPAVRASRLNPIEILIQ